MTQLVPDHQQIAIERWKASLRTAVAIGVLLCAAGWFDVTYRDSSQGWLTQAYLVSGPTLIGLGIWLLVRGPRLPPRDADKDAPPE